MSILQKCRIGSVKVRTSNRQCMFATSDRNKGQWSSLDKLSLTPEQPVQVWLKDLEIPVLLCKPVFTNRDGSTGEMYLVSNNLELSKDTLVWKEGMNNWLAAGTIPELSGLFITVAQTGWKKYLMWAAIVIGVIIVYSAIVGDDKGSTVERTYIYEDLAASIYTLVLNEDNTAVLTEDGKYRKASYKGSWERLRLKINNAPIIAIRYSNGGSQYIREDYIYETFDAMEAKDDKYGFKITRQ